jgi:dimethylaniline monooxygenase (N-oxide forming)
VKVSTTFPQLATPPPHYQKPVSRTPYRLYRHIIPLSESGEAVEDRSIAFIGQVVVANYFHSVECQAMWATAYLDGKLDMPSKEEQEREVALLTTWCRRRYLSNGDEGNNMTFEHMGYNDTLLKDMGLRSHRKGWFKDLFAPTLASEYKGLKAEFIKRFGYDKTV